MTTSPPSPKINGGEILGTIHDRFRRQAGWKLEDDSTDEARNDRKQFIAASLEVLGACRVPANEFERLYRRVMVSRARSRANGESVNYKLSAEDLATEWFVLEKESSANLPEVTDTPTELCRDKNLHISGESIVEYFFGGAVDVVLPCMTCRPKEFELRKGEHLEKHNASFANRRLRTGTDEEIEEQEKINKFTGAYNKPLYVNLKDPIEIINRGIDAVNKLMVQTVGTEEYENWRKLWLKLMNARTYVREVE